MKISVVALLKYFAFLALAILLLFWAFEGQDVNKLTQSIRQANPFWIALSVLACLAAHLLRALRWNLLIRTLGHQPSLKHSFYAVMVGYLANLAVPRMGEVSRCGVLKKTDQIPVTPLIGTVFTERLSDLVLLLSITGLAVLLEFKRIAHFMYQQGWLKIEALLSGRLFIGFLLGLGITAILAYSYKAKLKTKVAPLAKTLSALKSGALSFKNMPNKGLYLSYSIAIWIAYFLSTYFCFFALSGTQNLGLLAALAALVFGSLGMIVPVQGGMGAFHWMVAEGLTLYNIPKTEGLSFATLIHSSQIVVILVIGGISLLLIAAKKTLKTEQ